jgi:hypothetical protein
VSGKATPERLAELIADHLDLDALADKVAARMRSGPQADEWITPLEAARDYGRTAKWWRAHADEYGRREGDGPKPRIMLSVARIERSRGERKAA